MAMEVHGIPRCDMDHLIIRGCACLFHDKRSRGHYSYLFAFNFFKNMLVLPFSVLQLLLQKKRLCWQVMCVLDLPLLLDFIICMKVTLERPWVRLLPTTRGTSSLLFFFVPTNCSSFGLPFLSPLYGSSHQSFILFFIPSPCFMFYVSHPLYNMFYVFYFRQ